MHTKPRLRLGGLVHIDSNIISDLAYIPGTQSTTDENGDVVAGPPGVGLITGPGDSKAKYYSAYTSPTGTYKILLMNYSGDTRGLNWYCELTCIGLDGNNVPVDAGNAGSALRRSIVPIPQYKQPFTTSQQARVRVRRPM
jgi:hypothetical protein